MHLLRRNRTCLINNPLALLYYWNLVNSGLRDRHVYVKKSKRRFSDLFQQKVAEYRHPF
jgi:hypothetical protein